MESISDAAAYTLKFINQTHRSIFLTGKAGTGKTTLLREILRTTHKNTVVVAPTGIAALNAGGVTIHSMFQLPFAAFIPASNVQPTFLPGVKFETRDSLRRHFMMSGQKKSVIRNMELLIIDEVSMLRADLLDAIDFMMQSVRKRNQPFGGVQVLFIGDLLQLPPVVKKEEWTTLKPFYKGIFFFHSHVVQQNPPLYIELSKIFRQTESDFISVLNNLRNNNVSREEVALLNKFVKPDFDLKANKGYITLTTHNAKADGMNAQALADLDGDIVQYHAEIVGEFPEKIFPVDERLQLKIGAQVMFIKNDLSVDKNYFNGKTGIISSLSDQEILVCFPDEQKTIEVERYEWQNIRYYVDESTKEIREEILGTLVHYPIKLAWAITVHKSQGLTFDKAALDVSHVFLPGQAYVALSRLRSLKGLVLLSPLQMNGISNDVDVMQYSKSKADLSHLEESLEVETRRFVHSYLKNSFDWQELAQEWRSHRFSYQQDAEKSEKSRNLQWAKQQSEAIDSLLEPSRKFISQLDKIFASEPFDVSHLSDRINAALKYFLEPMDNIVSEVLLKIEEVKRAKKAKTFFNELMELEELQTNVVLQMLRAQLLTGILASGKTICKENLESAEIKSYKNDKLQLIRAAYKEQHVELIEDQQEVDRYLRKDKSKKKEPRKNTVQETYELWIQKNTVKEIAIARKLTSQTIFSHIGKLIQAQAIRITDVLPQDRISALEGAFKGYTDESLSGLKEKFGDEFTWDELRLYRASQQA
ncbi:MAG TPA: helix-turn-helix domain-containing protein [Flavobacterium sp.]|jgi:hypothetical protein